MALASPFYIPSPPVNGFHVGPAYIHFYGLMYVIGITAGHHHHPAPLEGGRR